MSAHPSPVSGALCTCGHSAHWHSRGGAGDCEHDGDCGCLAFHEAHRYVALDIPAHAGSMDVLLLARKSGDPQQRVVIAVSEQEARWMHKQDRISGWEPNDPA